MEPDAEKSMLKKTKHGRPEGKTMNLDAEKFYRHVGARLKAIREMRKMSQDEVGCKLGVTFQQVQKYETGANRIPLDKAVAFAVEAGIDIPEILGEYCPSWRTPTDTRDMRLLAFLKSYPASDRKSILDTLVAIAEYFK